MHKIGGQVWWTHRPRGGYGWTELVPAVVVRLTRKRVVIRAQKRDGTWKVIRARPENVKPRVNGREAGGQ